MLLLNSVQIHSIHQKTGQQAQMRGMNTPELPQKYDRITETNTPPSHVQLMSQAWSHASAGPTEENQAVSVIKAPVCSVISHDRKEANGN